MAGRLISGLCKSSLVAASFALCAVGYAQAATPGVAGSWRWFNPAGSEVYFNPNHTAQHLVNGAVADKGVWKETSAGSIDVTWSSGWVDHWQISQDGTTMTGHNTNGALPTVTREH